jgi:hypothetical protein
MATEQGYSNQKKKGKAQFKTIHNVGSNSFGEAVTSKYLYTMGTGDIGIDAVEEVLGNNGQVEFWKLTIANHGGQVGGVVRMYFESSLPNFEFEIISVVDVDNLLVLPISESMPIGALDSCMVYNWVTGISDPQGNPQVTVTPSPLLFILDSNVAAVTFDNTDPALNTPLPALNMILQDGVSLPVAKDTATPTNTISLPVEDFVGREILTEIRDAQPNGFMVPVAYNEIVNTYVGAGTDLDTVTYKASGTTVATLTFSYDGSNRLIGVVRS